MLWRSHFLFVAGCGNNGGDAFVWQLEQVSTHCPMKLQMLLPTHSQISGGGTRSTRSHYCPPSASLHPTFAKAFVKRCKPTAVNNFAQICVGDKTPYYREAKATTTALKSRQPNKTLGAYQHTQIVQELTTKARPPPKMRCPPTQAAHCTVPP